MQCARDLSDLGCYRTLACRHATKTLVAKTGEPRMIKRMALAAFCALLIIYSVLLYKNNVLSAPVSQEEIENSFIVGVDWLVRNRLDLYEIHNPYLWWMISEARRNSRNPALSNFYQEYLLRLRENPQQVANPFNVIFLPSFQKPMPAARGITAYMEPYQLYLYYSFTCDSEWGNLKEVVQQHDPEFCWKHHPFQPACVTHQLLGYWYQQIYKCHKSEILDPRISRLKNYIHIQLLLDPRVLDVYLQRVLMLALTGDFEGISQSWVRQILDAQLEAGAWGSNDLVLNVGGGHYIGFTRHGIGLLRESADFHATAQGIFLMSILRDESN
jgi:hypothetical protein